ncbi:hypothetical protein [Natronobeatus ordinarius]|uniref:hypothetical protein n=1 Tax=Natronobeatus ordinarius TaxID=2963433 RepID=UPI0020CE2B67|nr:hypothetical protein [Natronobeatus ordinarius]
MRTPVNASFEYNRWPVLWAAVVMVVGGLVVNFGLNRPGWLLPLALLSGGVAAALSGYYEPSANNGALGVIVGTAVLIPGLAYTRVTWMFGIQSTGDVLFFTLVLSAAWFTVTFSLAILGYLGAIFVDFTRRRIGGPIGY